MSDTPEFRKRVEEALAKGAPIPDFPEVNPLKGLAMTENEAVKTWEEEGFSRGEALYLVAAMFCGNPGQGPVH